MIIITGTFKNTSNSLKLCEITIFPTGSLSYYHIYESAESSRADATRTSSVCHGLNFHRTDLKFSDIVPNTIMVTNFS